MLLDAGDDELPEGVSAVRLAHRNISCVEAADMAYFVSLRVLDLGDNKVSHQLRAGRWRDALHLRALDMAGFADSRV